MIVKHNSNIIDNLKFSKQQALYHETKIKSITIEETECQGYREDAVATSKSDTFAGRLYNVVIYVFAIF